MFTIAPEVTEFSLATISDKPSCQGEPEILMYLHSKILPGIFSASGAPIFMSVILNYVEIL